MLPVLRTLTSAKLAWFTLAQTLAPGAVATTHTRTRTTSDGQTVTQLVTRQPSYVVTNGAMGTGELLLKLGLQNARRVSATPHLWSQAIMTDAGVPELPPIYTSGRELGQKRRLTDRTIRNHVRELKACGFITRYQFRGREHAYCVWINPDFVWETSVLAPTSSELAPLATPAESTNGRNFPVKEVLEPLEPQKSTISEVDKLVTAREPTAASETGTPFTGTAGPPRGSEPAVQVSKSGAGGAGAARRERFYHQAQERGSGAKMAEAKRLVESFWSYAKALIYKGKTFNAEAERLAKNAIWSGVFHKFSTGEPADWLVWLKGLERRVELAAAWLQRNPSKWAAAPYAEVVAGKGYFDAGNQQGFARTAQWYHDELRDRKQGALERALDEAMTELRQRRALEAGQKRVQASKRAKQKCYSELHRFHQTKLRALGGDEGLYRFAARLQAEHLLTLPSA